MINHEKLKESLVKYKAAFENRWPDERYKWEAVKWFQEHWDINADNFYEMFTVATDKTWTNDHGKRNRINNAEVEKIKQDRNAMIQYVKDNLL